MQSNFKRQLGCERIAIEFENYPLLICSLKESGKSPASRKELSQHSFEAMNDLRVQFTCKGGHSNSGVTSEIGS
jgi:hypothetical protein